MTPIYSFFKENVRYPVSSEISDLCEISDLLLFFGYFASQNKGLMSGISFFEVCCAN